MATSQIAASLLKDNAANISNPGIKTEYEPFSNDLLMNPSGMGLSSWLDPSTSQLRPLPFPQLFGGNGFDFNFATAMPFALSGPQASLFRPYFPSRRFYLPFLFRRDLSYRSYFPSHFSVFISCVLVLL